jgi:hypothetical protein
MKVLAFVKIREINGSLYFLIPREIVRAQGFEKHDRVEVGDGKRQVTYRKTEAGKQ